MAAFVVVIVARTSGFPGNGRGGWRRIKWLGVRAAEGCIERAELDKARERTVFKQAAHTGKMSTLRLPPSQVAGEAGGRVRAQ